jgi:hypothetical protein
MAWWQYEAAIPWPGYDRERSTLWRAGILDLDEKIELEAEWRRDFEHSQQPGFWFCAGPDKQYSGAIARRALYAWADIPPELVRRWTAGRRQAAQTIQGLLDQGQEKTAPATGIADAGS